MYEFLKRFAIDDSFLGRYAELVKKVMIPYQEKVLKDQIPGVEKSHAIENFRIAANVLETGKNEEEFYGMVFQDSDVAKWLEAVAYSLVREPDLELEKRSDAVIDLIGRAQHKDGYLNTYFTVKEPNRRWTNLEEAHELYCAGHMMEAAAAYAEVTGKTKLLEIMSRMADHMYQHFIVEGAPGYPGHPEVELALMRMYRATGNQKYRDLAVHFIDARGVDSEYFAKEREKYPWTVWGSHGLNKEYMQCQEPVREQTKAVGHAVRAVYLYTGMADAAIETKDETLKHACKVLWNNITQCRMYITGAIGSAYEGEAFTKDYHLPNDTAYAETCAAIGLIFFTRKMLEMEKDAKYTDVMERALYNCVLGGMQMDGTKFFYVNPLEVIPGISGEAVTHRHVRPQRPEWFACACCPPNVARLLTSIQAYAWSEEKDTVYSHLFIGGVLSLSKDHPGKILVKTEYPYGNQVSYRFAPEGDSIPLTLAIRIPGWSNETVLRLNGKPCDCRYEQGYAYITHDFTAEDEITVTFDLNVRRVYASTKVSADSGRCAFTRGPLVYCAEGADNGDEVLSLSVKQDGEVTTYVNTSGLLKGVTTINVEGYRLKSADGLYSYKRPEKVPETIHLIPYYAWGNRGLNQMRVWLPEE